MHHGCDRFQGIERHRFLDLEASPLEESLDRLPNPRLARVADEGIGGNQLFSSSAWRIDRSDQHQGFFGERKPQQAALRFLEVANDRGVEQAPLDPPDQFFGKAHREFDMHGRITCPKRNQSLRHHSRYDTWHDPKPEMTLDQGVAADLIQPIIRFNRLNRSRQEGPTAWRQNWRAACPIEQYEAELIFQRLHLHGHGRLRASDRTGCRGERAAFRDGQKGAEIANRHNHLHKISRLRSTYFNFFKSKASRTWLTTTTGGGSAARLQPSWLRRVGRGRGHTRRGPFQGRGPPILQ